MFWLGTTVWLTTVGALAVSLHAFRSVSEFWTCRSFWTCLTLFPVALAAPPLAWLLTRLIESGF